MLQEFRDIIVNYVNVEPESITEASEFVQDLGFNSYDFMSCLGDLEDAFDVEINERDVMDLKTVGEAMAYIQHLQEEDAQ